MEKSKLHSSGKNDHLKALKKEFIALRNKIIGNELMSETEKRKELKSLKESFENRKKNADSNLY